MMDIQHIQAMVEGLGAQWQRERAETQMTLGKMIEALEGMAPTEMVANLTSPHSYRGYYTDLAFERDDGLREAGGLLSECKSVMGQVLEGYKGGDYTMGANTPVWVASYGCCGQKIMAVLPNGELETAEDE